MSKKKTVLVLLSSYNGEKYISQQIDSILGQTGLDKLNILVRDDGSSDKTLEILSDYKREYPTSFDYIAGNNIGCNGSFLELLEHAKNFNFYSFSDQDDVWKEDKLVSAINMIESLKYDGPVLYGSCSELTDEKLNVIGETTKQSRKISFENIIIQNFLPGHTQVMNQKLVDLVNENKISSTKIFYYDYWIATIAMAFGKIVFDNTSRTLYRQHESNELGFGKGNIGWIKERIQRIIKGDSMKMASQISEFYQLFQNKLKDNQRSEIQQFFDSQRSFFSRAKYLFKTPFYRQSRLQTILFYGLYLIGGYKQN